MCVHSSTIPTAMCSLCVPVPKLLRRRGPDLTDLDLDILRSLFKAGKTALALSVEFDIQDSNYGPYQAISRRVAVLRRLGLVEDVQERCPHCGSARTRGNRNTILRLTDNGRQAILDRLVIV